MKSLTTTQIETIVKNKNIYAVSPAIKNCSLVLTKKGRPWAISGGQCRVYRVIDGHGQDKALRLWNNALGDIEKRCYEISSFISICKNKYLLDFEYIEKAFLYNGESYPAIIMNWCSGKSLKAYIQDHLQDKDTLRTLQNNLMEMFDSLHNMHISHGDLHHDNIRVDTNGEVYLIDYDSVYVPNLCGYTDECAGYEGYQHPTARINNKYLSEYADYFSELIIYLSIEALIEEPSIWQTYKLEERDQAFLFLKNDFFTLRSTPIYRLLCCRTKRLSELFKILEIYLGNNDISSLKNMREMSKKLNLCLFDVISKFCVSCGQEFLNSDDVFCINCGCKRII